MSIRLYDSVNPRSVNFHLSTIGSLFTSGVQYCIFFRHVKWFFNILKMSRSSKAVRTLEERLKIIEEVEKCPGEKRVDIAKRLGLPPSTLNTIVGNKDELRQQANKFGSVSKKRKTARESKFKELEDVLFKWYQQMRASNVPLDGSLVKEKAKQIALRLGIEDFAASNGWISRFKDRHGLVYKKISGECAAVNEDVTKSWLENLPKLIEGFEPHEIYNADETGLFFKCLPDRTLALKGEACHGGKNSKDRITVLLCSNSDGSDKLQPLVIGKSQRPRCFKNIKHLPVKYVANTKAWMTADIFGDFLRSLDCRMGARCRKILLFVDNCAAHPHDTSSLRNIKVIFYPPNCTSVLQPLDMGIIKCFKQKYRKMLVQKALCLLDSQDGNKAALKITILQAIHYVAASWQKISQSTISNCFAKCGVVQASPSSSQEVEQEDTDAFEADWKKLDPNNVGFENYANCDSDLVTCGVQSVDALCDEALAPENSDEEPADCEATDETVPSFSEAYAAFEKVKSFCYAQTLDDKDHLHISKMEDLLFRMKCNAGTKQLSIKDFFKKK